MSTAVDGGVGARSGGIWPGAIFALLGFNVVVVAVTVYFAVTDPSASIEPNYYEKAVRWDESAARRASSGRLGWGVDFKLGQIAQGRELLASLRDADGIGIDGARVQVEMFHHARAGDRRTLRLEPRGEGVYAGRFGPMRDGTWRLRLMARRGADVFVAELDQAFHEAGVPGAVPRENGR